jgi:hypothetical protein
VSDDEKAAIESRVLKRRAQMEAGKKQKQKQKQMQEATDGGGGRMSGGGRNMGGLGGSASSGASSPSSTAAAMSFGGGGGGASGSTSASAIPPSSPTDGVEEEGFGFETGKYHNLQSFKKMADDFMETWTRDRKPKQGDVSPAELETEFWKILEEVRNSTTFTLIWFRFFLGIWEGPGEPFVFGKGQGGGEECGGKLFPAPPSL